MEEKPREEMPESNDTLDRLIRDMLPHATDGAAKKHARRLEERIRALIREEVERLGG